jgi:hypothetical protein
MGKFCVGTTFMKPKWMNPTKTVINSITKIGNEIVLPNRYIYSNHSFQCFQDLHSILIFHICVLTL